MDVNSNKMDVNSNILDVNSNDSKNTEMKKHTCDMCAFSCNKNPDWIRHTLTKKHLNRICLGNLVETYEKPKQKHTCKHCDKTYSDYSGLWRHRKTCLPPQPAKSKDEIIYDLLMELCVSNAQTIEIQKQMIKVAQDIPLAIQTIKPSQHTNHNRITINMFLNEQCKDALTMDDFIKRIEVGADDMKYLTKNGNRAGLLSIIKNSLDQLQLTERPLHCTDTKRHTTYVKEIEGWNKETDQKSLKKLCEKTEDICRKKSLEIIQSDPRYMKNGTPEYEETIKMMQETNGNGPDKPSLLKSLEEMVVLEKDTESSDIACK